MRVPPASAATTSPAGTWFVFTIVTNCGVICVPSANCNRTRSDWSVIRSPTAMALEIFLQRDRVVVALIARAVDERDSSATRGRGDRPPCLGMRIELATIPLPEFSPLSRIMTEPFAQFGAWRDILHPCLDLQFRLGHAARPQPLDEHTRAVRPRHRLVRSFQHDHQRSPACRSKGAA